jgi:hypothetical protein
MIKKITTTKEIVENHKYCDVCEAEIRIGLACSKATCEYCGKDLCDKCIAFEDYTWWDGREVYCEKCNNLRLEYTPKILELQSKIDQLEEERKQRATLI